jgi:hypothetical protein
LNAIVSIGTGVDTEWSRFGLGRLGKLLTLFNAVKKWASDAEHIHETMLAVTDHGERVPYYRINAQDGIGAMKLDECKVDRYGSILTKVKKWLNIQNRPPVMSTLEYIKEGVNIELNKPETQDTLDRCAVHPVRSRRLRVKHRFR